MAPPSNSHREMRLPEPGEKRQVNVVKPHTPRADVDPTVLKAAEGLESMFLDTMFKAMRGTVQKSELSLDNSATEIYRGMLDQETAQRSARSNGIGLADQIVAYLESRGYTKQSSQAVQEVLLMRINPSQPNSVQSAKPETKTDSTKSALSTARAEKLKQMEAEGAKKPRGLEDSAKPEISAKAKEYGAAYAVAATTPDVREDKIADLKKRISDGSYRIDNEAVADKMISEHMAF